MRVARGFLAVLVVAFAVPAGAAEPRIGGPVPQQVLDDWQARRNQCQSVHYKVLFRELLSAGFLNGHPNNRRQGGLLPESDLWREREFTVWIDLANRRIRCEIVGRIPDVDDRGNVVLAPLDRVEIQSEQGSQLLNRNFSEGQKEPSVALTNWPTSYPLGLDSELLPCRWGLGVETQASLNGPNSFLNVIRPEEFRVHAVRRGETSTVLVLRGGVKSRPRSYLELEIDLDHASEIIGCSMINSDAVSRRIDVKWSRTGSTSHPVSWTDVHYRPDGRLMLSGEAKVMEWSCAPDLSSVSFRIDPEPGMIYADMATNDVFIRSANGSADVPYELYAIHTQADKRRSWWIVSGVMAVVLVVGVWLWSRRSARIGRH